MSYALRFPTPTRRLGEPQPAMPTLNPGPGGWAEWASLLSTERRQLFPVGSAILTSAGTAAGSEAVPPPVIPAAPGTPQSNGQNQNPSQSQSQSQSQSHSLPSTNGTAAPQSTAAPTNQRGMRQTNSESGAERDGAARGVSPAGVRSADDVDDADASNVNETNETAAAAVAAVASAASGPSVMSTVVLQPTQCNVRAPLLPAHGAPMTKAFLSSGGVESIVRSLFSRAKSHLAPAAAPTVGGQRSPHNDDGSPNSVVAGGAKDVLPPRGVSPSQLSAKGSPASEFQDAAVSPPGMALPSAEALPCDNAGVAGGGSGLPGPGAGARRFGPRTADIQHLTTILTVCLQEPPQSRAEFVPQIARRLAQVATFVCNANLPSDEEATLVDALVTAVTALCRPIADFEAPEPPTTATVQRSGRTGTSGEKRPKRRSATAVADDDDADDVDVDGVDLDADPEVDGEMLTVSQRDEEGRADDRRTPGGLDSQRRTYDDDDEDDDDVEGDATERGITGGGPGGRGSTSGRGRSGFDAFARRNPGGVLKVTASAAPPPAAVAASATTAAGPKTPGVKVATFPSAVPAPPGRGGPNSRGSSPVGFHPPPPPTVSSFQQQGQQGQPGQQQGLPQGHHDRGPSPPNSATLRPTSSPYSAAGGAGGTPRGTPRGGGLGPTASSVTFDRNASSVYYPTTPGTPGSGAVPTESFASHLSGGGANAAARDRRNGPGVNSTSISRQHTFDGGFGATSTHDHNTDDEVGLLRDPNATQQTQHTAPAALAAMRPPQRQHSIVSSVGGATANTHTTSWGSPMTPAGAAASLGLGGSFNRGYHGRGFASTPSPAARGASSTLQSVSNSVVLMPIALGGAAVVGPRARTAPTRRTTGSSAAGGATSTMAAAGDSVPTPPPPGRFGKAAGSSGGAGSSSFSLNFHLSLPATAGLGKRRDALSRAERLAEWCVSRADETIAAYRDAKAADGHTRTVLHELIDNLREHYEVTDRDHHAVAVEAIEVEALWVRAEVEAAHDAAFTRLQLFHQSAVANDLDKTRAELRKKLERLTTRSQRAQLQLTSLETKMKKLTYAFPGCHDELMPRTSSRSPPPSSPVRDSPSIGPFGSPSTPNAEGGPTPARRDRRNSTTLAGAATPSAAARTPSGRGNVAPPALAANAAAVGASGKKRSDSTSTPSSPDNASSIRRRSDSFGGDKHRISTIDPMRRERFEMEMKHMLAYRDQCEANAGAVAISSASVVGNSDTNAGGSVASPATPGARRELSTVVRGGKSSLRVPATSAQFVATLKSPNTAGPPPATSSFGHHAASATSAAQGTGGHRLSVLRKKLADTSEIAAAAKKRTLAAKLCWSFTEALTRGTEECSSDLLECREKRVGSLIESAGRSLQESVSASKELVQQLNNGRAMFVEALESAPPISSVPETLVVPTTPIVLDASLRDRVQSSAARAATASGGGGNGGSMPVLAASSATGLAGSGSLHRTASIASATSVMTSASALSASTVARDDPSPSGGFGSLAGGVGDTSAGSVSLPGGASVGAAVAQTPAYFGRAQFPDTAGASGARSPQFRSSASLSQLDEIEMTQSEAGDDGEGRTSGDSNLLSGGQRSAANDGSAVGGSGTDRLDPSREKAKDKDKEKDKEKVIGARRAALRRPARQSGTPGPAPAGATSTTGSIAKGSVATDAGVTPSPAPNAPGANAGGKLSATSAGATSVLATPPPLSLPALLACVSRDFGFLEHAKAVLRMMVLTGEKAELQRNRMAVLTEMWRQEQGDADASVERLVHMRESTQKAFDALALLVESTREDALEVAHRELFTRLSRLHSPLISAGGAAGAPGSATTDGSRTGTGGSGNSGGVGGGGFFSNSPSGGAPQLNASADNHHTFPQHPGGAGAHTASHGHSESSSMRRNTTDDLATVSVSTNETRTPGISGSVTRQPTPSLMQAGVHGGGAPNFGATVGPSDARASAPHGQGNPQDGGGGFGEALSHRQDSNVSASTAPGTPGSISHHPHGLLGGPPVAPIPEAALGSPPGSIPTAGSNTAGVAHDGATHPPGSLGSDMHGAHQWGGSMLFQHTPSSLGMTSSSTANFMAGMITGSSAFSRAGSAAFGSPQTPGSAGPGAARRGVPKRLRKKMAELSFMHPPQAGAMAHPSHQGLHLPRASTGGTVGTVGTSHEDLSALHTGTTDLATGAPTTGSPNVDNAGVALAEQGSGGGGSGSALARGSNGAGGSGGSTADMTDGGTPHPMPGAGLVGLAGGVGVAHGGGAAGVGGAPAYGMSLEMSSWFTPQGSQMMQAMSFGPGTPGGPRGAAAAPWQGFMVDFLDAFQGPQTPVSVPPTPPREPKPQ